MFDFLSKLVGIRAEDGTHGLAGLNLRMVEFANRQPRLALGIIGILVLAIAVLIYLITK